MDNVFALLFLALYIVTCVCFVLKIRALEKTIEEWRLRCSALEGLKEFYSVAYDDAMRILWGKFAEEAKDD